MKINWKIVALFFLSAFFTFTSCRPDGNNTLPDIKEMTEEDALDIIETAVVDESGGIAKEVEQAATIAEDYAYKNLLDTPCGVEKDTGFVYEHNGNLFTAAYSTTTTFILNCNDLDVPESLDYMAQTTGTYTGQAMSSSDIGQSVWNLDNLTAGTDYILNGTYMRSGTQNSLVRNQNSFVSNMSFTLEDVSINKGNYRIDSGVASYVLEAATDNGNNYTFEGTIVFSGNQTAEVIINGHSYQLEW